MAKKTLYFVGILLTIVVGSILYFNYCSSCRPATAVANSNLPDTAQKVFLPAANGLKLISDSLNYQCTDNFDFLKGGFKTLLPVSDSVTLGLDKLKVHLAKNPNVKVLITGYAKTDEKNTSTYANLGEARAADVKEYLVSKGFTANRFDTKGEITDSWCLRGDTVLGPVNIAFTNNKTAKATEWDALKLKINADPLILHFETARAQISLTAQEKQKVSDIVDYLGHVGSGTLYVVGHTDNSGNRASNIRLGQRRAEFVKGYFVKNGIEAAKIKTSSKGPDEPIADNTTAEGKSKNRRTVVTIN
jgi:OmpA-OmpF porin, OOP family